jgi:membrane protein DedA with SNARE-associated domain
MFEHFFTDVRPYIEQYGYWAIFVGVLLDDLGIPMPGETILIAGALMAGSTGAMSIVPLLVTAWAAAVIGDNLAYALGRFAGRRLVLKYGHMLFVTPRRLRRVENFYERYGGHVVIIARFLTLVRQLNGIVAGIGNMPWWTFLAYNALGAALWAGFWGLLSFWLGERTHSIAGALATAGPLAALAGLVALVVVAFRSLRWKRRKEGGGK